MKNNIKKLRLAAEMSQQDLADAIGTTRATIMKLEKGDMGLTTDWMERIAKGLHCSAHDLMDGGFISHGINDSDVALSFAVKLLIQAMLSKNITSKENLRRNFDFALDQFRESNLPGAIAVMSELLTFVTDESPQSGPAAARKLLQLVPVGSA